MCFCVYEVHTILTESNTSHGAQIPQLSGESAGNLQLSISVNSSLKVNEHYSAVITTISDEEEIDSIGTIEFSKS